jgi:hypothetical protein
MQEALADVVLLACQVQARAGVPFNLVVTNRTVTYTRMVSFKRHPTETLHSTISQIRDVTLKRRSPWFLWIVGSILLLSAVMWLCGFFFGEGERSIKLGLCGLMLAMAFGCFVGGRHRHVLEWHDGERRHRVVQPMSLSIDVRNRITAALRDAALLMTDPAALKHAEAHAREQARED